VPEKPQQAIQRARAVEPLERDIGDLAVSEQELLAVEGAQARALWARVTFAPRTAARGG
jgi:hypothetical protein